MWTAKRRAEGPYYGDNYITLVEIECMTMLILWIKKR